MVTFTSVQVDPTTCVPGNDGSVTITASGGSGTYQYSKDNGISYQASNVFSSLSAGSYQVIVKDINSCVSAMSAISLTALGGLTFTSVKQDAVCNGGSDGSITLTASGGSGGNQFSKDNGATFQASNVFAGLIASTYQMVALDNSGCQFSSSITISQPVAVTFTSVDVSVSCNGSNDGSITITASGGNNTYQYSKDNGVTFQLGSSFSALAAGIYQVVVKDGNNCISVATPVTITEPAFVSAVFSGLAGPYCTSSGVVNLVPITIGGTFTGPGVSGSTFSPSTAGVGTHTIQYSVTSSGCTYTTTQQATVISSTVDASFSGLNPTYCPNSLTITLTPATPGGTFSGNGITGNTFNPSTAGSGTHTIQYSVISGGCTSTTSQSVNVLLSTDPICTSGTGTGTCATVVIVPKPSPATCTSSDGKIVFSIKPFIPIINNTGVKIDIKGISSTNLAVSRTNLNDSTFLNLPLGTYDFTIEYGDPSCIKTGLVTIGQTGTVGSPVATNIVRPLCFGEATGSLTLDIAGETGNTLEWSLDGITWTPFIAGSVITGVPAGIAPLFERLISVRRNSSDLCNAVVLIVLQEINPAISASMTTTNATCNNNDGTIVLSGIAGGSGIANFTYKLNGTDVILPADNIIKGLSAGAYTFSIIDNVGCQKDFAPVDVKFPGFVNFTIPVVTAPDCTGAGDNGIITFQITDIGTFQVGYTLDPIAEPTNYFDSGGAPITISNLSNGNYFVWIKSLGLQCVTKLSPISINGTFPVNFSSIASNVLCLGTMAEISLSSIKGAPNLDYGYELVKAGVTTLGAITFAQSLGEYKIPNLGIGNYQVRLTQNQSSLVPACTTPIATAYQDVVIIGPSEVLDTLYVKRVISVPDLPTGSMLVGIKESKQEPYEVMLELINPLFPGQDFVIDWTAASFNTQKLKVELNIRNLFAGDYKLSLRDGLGCVKEYAINLGVDTNLAVPNIFTPNGDGVNDVFFVRNLPTDANLIITNRWGKEVYSSSNYQNNWDGGDISDGVYFYRLNLPSESRTGWVEILRGK
ncbi:MAG: gliding motility-associated C-terminal domain-containing protein [Bacteroidia bacterium]|nr:gliding motility-associated C-terminal domain-containing protein [Bacteroidia bacterium]